MCNTFIPGRAIAVRRAVEQQVVNVIVDVRHVQRKDDLRIDHR
jgi:hypothetical protein